MLQQIFHPYQHLPQASMAVTFTPASRPHRLQVHGFENLVDFAKNPPVFNGQSSDLKPSRSYSDIVRQIFFYDTKIHEGRIYRSCVGLVREVTTET
ncbi:Uncharacterized protein HZ326_30213 [Fusarium oxysporum f. sp. albedinis]|nr:Uncharacterized protein HZ326_30213 [Fusarium oxysporum f. sp. albedinis]